MIHFYVKSSALISTDLRTLIRMSNQYPESEIEAFNSRLCKFLLVQIFFLIEWDKNRKNNDKQSAMLYIPIYTKIIHKILLYLDHQKL